MAIAEDRKVRVQYPDLARSSFCKFICVAQEVGGRLSSQALDYLAGLAKARALSAAPILRRSTYLAYSLRWRGLVSVAAQLSLAASLLPHAYAPCPLGFDILLSDVLTDGRIFDPAPESRLA